MKTRLPLIAISLAALTATAAAGPGAITAKKKGMVVNMKQTGKPTADGSEFRFKASSSHRTDTHRLRGQVVLYDGDALVGECPFEVTLKPAEVFEGSLACDGGWDSFQFYLDTVEVYNEHTDEADAE